MGSIYSNLYNSADDGDKLRAVHARAEAEAHMAHMDKVSKITPELLKKAANLVNLIPSIVFLQTASEMNILLLY